MNLSYKVSVFFLLVSWVSIFHAENRDTFLQNKIANNPTNRLSPFVSQLKKTPTHSHDLMNFVGFIKQNDCNYALIRLDEKKIIFVKEGDRVGGEHEKILKIEKNKIVLEKKVYVDGLLKKKQRKLFLEMHN